MPSDAWNEAYDAWESAKADSAKYTSKMWAENLGSKKRAEYETLANEAKARQAAAKKRLTKIEADERKALNEEIRATKAAERDARTEAVREDQEDRIGQRQTGRTDRTTARQGGRTDRTTVRQGGQTDRTEIRQSGMTDRTELRQNPENVAARAASTAAWAEPTGEAVTGIAAAAAAALAAAQAAESGAYGGGMDLSGIVDSLGLGGIGDGAGKAAADQLLTKAIPYVIGAVLLGVVIYFGTKKK